MITVFHGDNFVLSRQALNHSLANSQNILRFEAKKINPEALTQALESTSLFGKQDTIVIENLLSLARSKDKQALIDLILKNHQQVIYLWEKKSLTPAVKKQFSSAVIKEFKLAKVVFQFLDSLKPGNQVNSLKLLHQGYQKDAPELIFYLLSRRLSQLIQALSAPDSLKSAPWQISRLKSQARNFSLQQLLSLHQKLIQIDYQIKTGQTDLSLATQLDLLLASI